MPIEVWRPGDYRVCPSCGTRHKVQDLHCTKCHTVLAGAPVRHAASADAPAAAPRPSRGLRMLLVVALVAAAGAGLWVRNLFRGASLQDSVQASSAASTSVGAEMAPSPEPEPSPSWAPPVLQYPPIVGYNRGETASTAGFALQASPAAAADAAGAASGMISIAPPTEPTRKTTFTNDDPARTHEVAAVVPVSAEAHAPASTPGPATAVAPARAPVVDDGARDEWISRVRDREDDLQKAQANVRRRQAEVDLKKADAARASDPDAREQAQQDVMDALDALDKAERKAADRQRDLDEAKDRARAAGVRIEG